MIFPGTMTPAQQQIVAAPSDQGQHLFVCGPAGAGKSTALKKRLASLLAARVPSHTVLTIVSEQNAADGFRNTVADAGLGPHSGLTLVTFYGFAREMVTLFWPVIAQPAGFAEQHGQPVFLSYDMAQIQMRQVIAPMLAEGAFEGLRLRPQQILSQLLDNLNRAALNGLTLDEMETRLVRTWAGALEHAQYFSRAADAARRFRQRCLDTNTLDLSLVIEVLQNHLLDDPMFVDYITRRYRHLLADNVEEMPPAAIRLVQALLPGTDSAVVVYDEGGGYRRYLAADPQGAMALADECDRFVEMQDRLTSGRSLQALANVAQQRLTGKAAHDITGARDAIIQTINPRFRREMIQEVIGLLTGSLLAQVASPSEIAIVAPYLDAALQHGLVQGLAAAGVPYRLLRRRGSPRDDSLVRAWLTLSMLAHPTWGLVPSHFDVAEALSMAVDRLDRPRATLAARRLYDPAELRLWPADILSNSDKDRIGLRAVERIDALQRWLVRGPREEPLDRFLGYLFAELNGAPPLRPEGSRHRHLRQAAACNWLIQTAARFRNAAPALGLTELTDQGRVFIESILGGIVSRTPPDILDIEPPTEDGVLISTVYAYLLAGPAVQIQIWLEASATGWWETPRQPLSNAFVLAPGWDPSRPWTEAENYAMRNQLLSRLIGGLCSRCGRGVILASSQLDRRGERQAGPLWRALGHLVDER